MAKRWTLTDNKKNYTTHYSNLVWQGSWLFVYLMGFALGIYIGINWN